ncbi:MAG: prepilin-type N-terminal cleavage/methylation domain-containing protein [Defluviitaleaceae bacterium]|nr:prepilin-type N-terminal cleavage/methylation domain-containing protein [Defluviitaleaceae bacterium]
MKGVTLIELVVAMLVFTIIMATATAVFAPMLRAFSYANSIAEANTLMDNVATLILHDLTSATDIEPQYGDISNDVLEITTFRTINFYLDNGILRRRDMHINPPDSQPLLDSGFFTGDIETNISWQVFYPNIVELTIAMTNHRWSWSRERIYVARPVAFSLSGSD